MFKYRSRCRFNMLLAVDEVVVEIRPQEVLTSKSLLNHKYLDLIEETVLKLDIEEKLDIKKPSTKIGTKNARNSTRA